MSLPHPVSASKSQNQHYYFHQDRGSQTASTRDGGVEARVIFRCDESAADELPYRHCDSLMHYHFREDQKRQREEEPNVHT